MSLELSVNDRLTGSVVSLGRRQQRLIGRLWAVTQSITEGTHLEKDQPFNVSHELSRDENGLHIVRNTLHTEDRGDGSIRERIVDFTSELDLVYRSRSYWTGTPEDSYPGQKHLTNAEVFEHRPAAFMVARMVRVAESMVQ